jgi:predicted CoA-binding protein
MDDERPADAPTTEPAGDSRARREREARRIRELIDFQEGRLGLPVLGGPEIDELLRTSSRIAVVGASADPSRPSNGVFRYLARVGYDVVPVTPSATAVDGRVAYPTLAAAVAATGRFDIVDVFRRAEACPEHAREAVEAGARCLWLQLGIVSLEAGRIATAAGLALVMDRCLMVDHLRSGADPPGHVTLAERPGLPEDEGGVR